MASRPAWPSADLPASVHGTGVAVGDHGVLFIGPSGSGKSSIAIQMISLGATLVSDDLVWLEGRGADIVMSYPPQAPGPPRIEARGVGLIPFPPSKPVALQLLVDLSQDETARLPEYATINIAGRPVRFLHKVDNPAFPAMVLQYLSRGVV